MNQYVQKGCSVKILGIRYFVCAKGVVGAKLTVSDRGLLQFGSDMQKGTFLNSVSDHGGVLFWEYPAGYTGWIIYKHQAKSRMCHDKHTTFR